jgi:hypothetical protein
MDMTREVGRKGGKEGGRTGGGKDSIDHFPTLPHSAFSFSHAGSHSLPPSLPPSRPPSLPAIRFTFSRAALSEGPPASKIAAWRALT